MLPRELVDPENAYPADGPRVVERRALAVLDHLGDGEVSRTRDVIQIDSGGEAGIVAVVTAEALELRLPTVEWTRGSYGPAGTSRLWRRVTWDQCPSPLSDLIAEARAARQEEFRECRYCSGRFPPEHRVEEDVCHGCASRHQGVVF